MVLRQKINIKYFMIGYLALLLGYSSVYLNNPRLFLKGASMVAFYVFYDLVWTRLRNKVWYVPLSSCISGLVLSVVAIPDPPFVLVAMFPLLAVISKHLLKFGKIRHVFNPASFAVATVALATPAIAWWIPVFGRVPSTVTEISNPGVILFFILTLGGLFILWRQKRWHVALPFFISYTFFLALLYFLNGAAMFSLPRLLAPQIVSGVTIFFASVMLIEPMTSTFNSWSQEVCYGGLVGFAAVMMTYFAGRLYWPYQDPLVYGLLIGNLVASLLFLPARSRLDTR